MQNETKNESNTHDPLPESFASITEAGEFWDTHDSTDYNHLMEDVEVETNMRFNPRNNRTTPPDTF